MLNKKFKFIGALMAVFVLILGLNTAEAGKYGKKDIIETAMSSDDFSILVTAVKEAGLVDALRAEGPFTVFAPTNAAFKKLPQGTLEAVLKDKNKLKAILTYHVVAGKVMAADVVNLNSAKTLSGQEAMIKVKDGNVMVANAQVVKTDLKTSNGVIHVIDEVMMPGDVVDVALGNENFSTLVTAVKAAGLVDALKGEGPFTVFAPTNDAFAKLPKGTVEALLKDTDKLASILTYHVVPGYVTSSDVVKVDKASTLNGEAIAVQVKGNKVMVDNARVVATDILCTNGIIHVIDEVIIPGENAKRTEK